MAMVQYSVWNNCNGSCDFCLRKERTFLSKEEQLFSIEAIKRNIDLVDWKDKFSDGISLLGGELYYITDKDVQDAFMSLVDVIIEKILKVSKNPNCRFSSVTNGMYSPIFLMRVLDRIRDAVGIKKVDINFSYDVKYRYKDLVKRKDVIDNINLVHNRYNYRVGVQMILTQYFIDAVNKGDFDIDYFLEEEIPGNMLCFLYPHPIHTGRILTDFYPSRESMISFILMLREKYPDIYKGFLYSTKNSGTFKFTGLIDKSYLKTRKDTEELPSLSDGKEIISSKCGHSTLYRCYEDSSACLLCDLEALEGSCDAI